MVGVLGLYADEAYLLTMLHSETGLLNSLRVVVVIISTPCPSFIRPRDSFLSALVESFSVQKSARKNHGLLFSFNYFH